MAEKSAQDLINSFPYGYACAKLIFTPEGTARDGVIIEANAIFEAASGQESGLLPGARISDLLTNFHPLILNPPIFILS
jgi:PAS domain-containing protein